MTAQTESKTKEKPPESRSAYTPGAWEVLSTLSTHNHPTRFWETGVIAKNDNGLEFVGHGAGATEEESRANARLIAAAPALYEAVRAILHWYDVDSSEFNRDTAIEQARAALALVKGGQ